MIFSFHSYRSSSSSSSGDSYHVRSAHSHDNNSHNQHTAFREILIDGSSTSSSSDDRNDSSHYHKRYAYTHLYEEQSTYNIIIAYVEIVYLRCVMDIHFFTYILGVVILAQSVHVVARHIHLLLLLCQHLNQLLKTLRNHHNQQICHLAVQV